MRFESKHNYFKELAHRVKCFKNIPKTMAQRHQEFMCYHLNGENSPFSKDSMAGPGTMYATYVVILCMLLICTYSIRCRLIITSLQASTFGEVG